MKWLVLEMKVPVDIGTSDGTTPFMYAVWQGRREVVKWLFKENEANAKKKKKESDGGLGGGGVDDDCSGGDEEEKEEGGGGGGCDINAVNSFGCNG